ncbi:hypothetical protein CLV63_13713 [Murinocardiopsis flavida]|uniref:DUF6879 domain-containing protein n=1 Tax=Murinocardiopsis flavida TaxID=645275 RepID=A0A2P8CLV4_9ACTN|nr:DUF6879 family protein [Murinocardiopsis flavida]PSK85954.1 hypothetical protein CLV63_13713 [Murinocardiopsis flavida]
MAINERPLTWDELVQIFDDFQHTAFRLETLQRYAEDGEAEPFDRFLSDGSMGPSESMEKWCAELRDKTARGLRQGRVHVVTEPLSDYMRFECAAGYRHSAPAGEQIRILAVQDGEWPQGLPHLDYWLFDSHQLVRMDYRADDLLLTPVLVTDPEQIVAANTWRDRAIHLSIPYADYEQRFDPYMRPR